MGDEAPSLLSLSDNFKKRALSYLRNTQDFVRLEQTCKGMNNWMKTNDDVWRFLPNALRGPHNSHRENAISRASQDMGLGRIRKRQRMSSNVILDILGGADGFRKLVKRLTCSNPLRDNMFRTVVRGDTIGFLVEAIQHHFIEWLEGALLIAVHVAKRCESYPVVTEEELTLYQRLHYSKCNPSRGFSVGDSSSCSSHIQDIHKKEGWGSPELLSNETRALLSRELGYLSGITEMSNDAVTFVAKEFVMLVGVLLAYAMEFNFQYSHGNRYSVPAGGNVDLFNDHPPQKTLTRHDDSHFFETTIIPRQMKEALERVGMSTKVYGCPWAVSAGKTEKQERTEAEAQYRVKLEELLDRSSDEDSVATEDTNSHASDGSNETEAFSCYEDEECPDSSHSAADDGS